MENQAPPTKECLALLRFEVICQIKTLRQEGLPLAECLRIASSRPWPAPDGNCTEGQAIFELYRGTGHL